FPCRGLILEGRDDDLNRYVSHDHSPELSTSHLDEAANRRSLLHLWHHKCSPKGRHRQNYLFRSGCRRRADPGVPFSGSTRRMFRMKLFIRAIVTWAIESIAVILFADLIPGVHITNWAAGVVLVLVIGLLNALVRPVILRLAVNLGLLAFALITFLLNGF